MRQLKRHVQDPVLLNLVRQYLHYSVERGGEFHTPKKGICRGCALSPLLAGFCLWAMDTYFEAQQLLRYVRFMDDIVILTRTRWHLRQAVRALNVFFASGGYSQHPGKTFIGRTERGFDWMGIQFNGSGVEGVAPRALANHRERCRRLYEQVWRYGKKKTMARVSAYVKRWTIWRNSMLTASESTKPNTPVNRALSQRLCLFLCYLTVILLSRSALAELPRCSLDIGYSTTAQIVSPPNHTPGTQPAYPLVAKGPAAAGITTTCLLPSNADRIAISTGPWSAISHGKYGTDIVGGVVYSYGFIGYNSKCSPDIPGQPWTSGMDHEGCLRIGVLPSAVACTGADGTASGTINSEQGLNTSDGGRITVLRCKNRPAGQGVTIHIGAITANVLSNSPDGYVGSAAWGSNQYKPPSARSAINVSLGTAAYSGSAASYPFIYLSGIAEGAPIPMSGGQVIGECVDYDDPQWPQTLTASCNLTNRTDTQLKLVSQPDALIKCTATANPDTLDWGTVAAGNQVPLQPIASPGATDQSVNLSMQCTDGSQGIRGVSVTLRGTAYAGDNSILASTNDSVGYRLILKPSGAGQVLDVNSTIQSPIKNWLSAGSDGWSNTIVVSPIALASTLLPGEATATPYLDLYAY